MENGGEKGAKKEGKKRSTRKDVFGTQQQYNALLKRPTQKAKAFSDMKFSFRFSYILSFRKLKLKIGTSVRFVHFHIQTTTMALQLI